MSLNGNIENKEVIRGRIVSVPLIDNTLSKKGQGADAEATGNALKNKVSFNDIVDNLTTNDAKKPLSASQGVVLNRNIGAVDTKVTNLTKTVEDNHENIQNDFISKANKPTGSYVGNGSATQRTVNVNGTGGCLIVFSGSYMIGFITQNGAMFFNTTNSSVKCFPVAQAKFMSGKLTISSADTFLNGNGNTYHYQVL